MSINFGVSVIIPAYNVERFIKKAILSALEQTEVTEVIVIDDGSTDATLTIVSQLQQNDIRIKIFHHPNKQNKGRSATRNLGLQKATSNFIAFLDADDYYLPNRFLNDVRVFEENTSCDGVYNAVGFHFYRNATEEELNTHQLYTVRQKVVSKELFENLLYGKCGHFHIDGLTVKKSVFETTGLFNEDLVVAEDTDLFWKMAIKCSLETGIIDKSIAVRGIHEKNIFDNEVLYKEYYIKMLESVLVWTSKNNVEFRVSDLLLKQIWILKEKEKKTLIRDINYWRNLFLPNYELLFSTLSIKYFPLIRYRQMIFPFLYKSKNN